MTQKLNKIIVLSKELKEQQDKLPSIQENYNIISNEVQSTIEILNQKNLDIKRNEEKIEELKKQLSDILSIL